MNDDKRPATTPEADSRRRFLRKAGTIVLAAPVMESLSKEGLLVRSAHAQSPIFEGVAGVMSGEIEATVED